MKNRDIMEIMQNWMPPSRPIGAVLEGKTVRLESLCSNTHSEKLFAANLQSDAIWDYLPYGPFSQLKDYDQWVSAMELDPKKPSSEDSDPDPMFYAIFDKERGAWGGVASYLRINPQAGSIEVGHINFALPLQKTRAATEAIYLMMKWAFEAGYRRFEWKCDAANASSRRAAARYGLSYEGVFRQAGVVKGRNRDTAWFAAIDSEWPALNAAFCTWLEDGNFDSAGRQKQRLSDLTRPILVAVDPGVDLAHG